MRLKISKSKNATQFYIIKDTVSKNGKRSTYIYEKLGNEQQVREKAKRRRSNYMGKKIYRKS